MVELDELNSAGRDLFNTGGGCSSRFSSCKSALLIIDAGNDLLGLVGTNEEGAGGEGRVGWHHAGSS